MPMSAKELQDELLFHLNDPPNGYDFFSFVGQYVEDVKGLDPDEIDPYQLLEDENESKKFMKWVDKTHVLEHWFRDEPAEIPPKFFFEHAEALPEGTWLIHHSNTSFSGFDRGISIEHLGLSTHISKKTKAGPKNTDDEIGPHERAYAFGFTPDEDPAVSRFGLPLSSDYGDRWYLFQTDAAVQAYHNADMQHQAIFPVGTEYNMVEVDISGNAPWSVYFNFVDLESLMGKRLMKHIKRDEDDVDDVILEADTMDQLIEMLDDVFDGERT